MPISVIRPFKSTQLVPSGGREQEREADEVLERGKSLSCKWDVSELKGKQPSVDNGKGCESFQHRYDLLGNPN